MKLYTHAQIELHAARIPPAERFRIVNAGIASASDDELVDLARKLPRQSVPRQRVSVLVELEPKARDRLDALRRRMPDASMSALFYRLLSAYDG